MAADQFDSETIFGNIETTNEQKDTIDYDSLIFYLNILSTKISKSLLNISF